jgi:hypothetical protein
MTKYTLLNHRRMNNEIRLSARQAIVIGIATFMAFVYAFGRNSCNIEDSSVAAASSSFGDGNLPTIYAVTPTYYRPNQKPELTRYISEVH